MSFSGKVKEELSRQISTARHCQIAEIAAILSVCGQVSISAQRSLLRDRTYRKCVCGKKVLYISRKNI